MKTNKPLNLLPNTLLILLLTSNISWSQSGNSISHERDGITFTFEFNCDNGPCQYGQFVTGDYWVVPSTPDGVVTITSISPTGEANGAMVNPDLLRDSDNIPIDRKEQKQGILPMYDHYDMSLNLMNSLPYQAHGNESIFKIKSQTTDCGTKGIRDGCVSTATVLTVLSEPPAENGAKTFRPPFHGDFKPLFTTDKLRMDRLPSLTEISTDYDKLLKDTEQWLSPQIELGRQGLGEFHRATIPHLAQRPYAADQARAMLHQISKLFGPGDTEAKEACLLPIIQKGIDNYGVFKTKIPFSSGAGQHLGKKPPLTLFAALYDDRELLEEIRAIALDDYYQDNSFFQEDSQIRVGPSGMAVWGDFDATFSNVNRYFGLLYPRLDNKGTFGDPYRYIDGPAGAIHPDKSQTRDRNYITVAGGALISYAFLQHLMPWYKYAAGDPEILLWADRIYDGYGIPNFDGGLWTVPDPVAPYDRNESDCHPHKGGKGCDNYGITWGPNLDDPSKFIPHNGDPYKDGRMPELHGYKLEFNRLIRLVKDHWDDLRPCADPRNPSYPCEGLGSTPSFYDPLSIDSQETAYFNIKQLGNILTFELDTSIEQFDISIHSIDGRLLYSKTQKGNEISISIDHISNSRKELLVYHIISSNSNLSGRVLCDYR
ncbi:hypothetical protein [Reichenbachiella versicolor]|uniref:hypothetical protein n=1 Tax=Reichenbachiella versicolor TaxID=1821036 RepID=UPI000D6E534D|nr:hypothetical protein [Reichenbachiella versicolor]